MPNTEDKHTLICPYCGKQVPWISNEEVYGKRYGNSYMCYFCKDCDAYVGCHNNTPKPLGTMANKELREWRQKAHEHIDPLWQSGKFSRHQVYHYLRMIFGKVIHVGESDIDMCKKILEIKFDEK